MKMSTFHKQMFEEQLEHSISEIERLKSVSTEEAGEQLRYHAAVVKDIEARLKIFVECGGEIEG